MGHDVKLLGYHVGGIRTFPCVGMSQNELSSSHPALQQDCRDMPQNQFIFTTRHQHDLWFRHADEHRR